jgi:hypothetical protein
MLLATAAGLLAARDARAEALPSEAALLHDIDKFQRRTSLYPKQDA